MNDIVNRAAILGAFLTEHADHINHDTFVAAEISCFNISVLFGDGVTPALFALDAFPEATITIRRVDDNAANSFRFHLWVEDRYRGERIRITTTTEADDPTINYAWANGEPNGKQLVLTIADLRTALSATEGA